MTGRISLVVSHAAVVCPSSRLRSVYSSTYLPFLISRYIFSFLYPTPAPFFYFFRLLAQRSPFGGQKMSTKWLGANPQGHIRA
jgi:hypothetical protein